MPDSGARAVGVIVEAVSLGFAGCNPAPPEVVTEDGKRNEEKYDEGDEELHVRAQAQALQKVWLRRWAVIMKALPRSVTATSAA